MLIGLRSKLLLGALAAAMFFFTAPARAEGPSRWVASLPFGAGQLQNGETELGIFFAASEAVLGAASIATVVMTNELTSADVRGGYVDITALNHRIRALAMVNRISFAAWAALTGAGIAHAHVRFAPQRRDTTTPLRPSVTALVAPLPGGGVLGVRGVF